jgi:hypothetical protein
MSKLVHLVSCPLQNIVVWLFARGWQKLNEKMQRETKKGWWAKKGLGKGEEW